jgi:hypothetical protein
VSDREVDPRVDPRFDLPLQLASRFMALLKSGRSYAVGHTAFTQQLDNYLTLLEPVLRAQGHARFDAPDGDLCMNGECLPFRPNMHPALERLAREFAARSVDGIEFVSGVTLPEFQSFMELFLQGESWKGHELITACHDAGIMRVRALAQRSIAAAHGDGDARDVLAVAPAATRAAWAALFTASHELLSRDTLDHGVELRHLKRIAQPLVDSVLAAEPIAAALARVTPGESVGAHAAHTTLAAVCVGARLGLGRHDVMDIAVAALLHDVGHGWAEPAGTPDASPHTREGVRRIACATTLNACSLDAMRTALEHHDPGTTGLWPAPALLSRLVGLSDAYVTFLSRGATRAQWISPSSALARVLELLRPDGPPALGVALLRALGCYPPGQLVELDDGAIARALVPVAEEPERPWVELVADERGMLIPGARREGMPLPHGRRITRALSRDQWPVDEAVRPAA